MSLLDLDEFVVRLVVAASVLSVGGRLRLLQVVLQLRDPAVRVLGSPDHRH